MKIDFLGTQKHFVDHLRPIVEACTQDVRLFYAGRQLRKDTDLVVTASITDYRLARRMKAERVVLFEHGAGFSFHGASDRPGGGGSYAGGPGRDRALALPATNHWVAEANLAAYPDIPSLIVGSPRVDQLLRIPRRAPKADVTIAVGFHWDCLVAPETRWALPHFEAGVRSLVKAAPSRGWRIIGTGHPRVWNYLARTYRRWGLWEQEQAFTAIVAQADLYVNDASSTLYEFAALDRPVVVMNAPWYRKDVQQGLRFWEHSDVGVNVDDPKGLVAAVEEALVDRSEQQTARRRAVERVYPFRGESAQRAVAVLESVLTRESVDA